MIIIIISYCLNFPGEIRLPSPGSASLQRLLCYDAKLKKLKITDCFPSLARLQKKGPAQEVSPRNTVCAKRKHPFAQSSLSHTHL